MIVFEATGGYERRLKSTLAAANYAFHMAHPNKVRAFAKAKGLLAKTDKIDAELIEHYAETMQPEADLSNNTQEIKELLKRREQLLADKRREQSRLDKEYISSIKRSMQKHVRWLTKSIGDIEEQLQLSKSKSGCQKQIELLTSIPCIGELTALYLLLDFG